MLWFTDRVVDKLNPTQVFTKNEVLKLMEYSEEELPKVDFNNIEEELFDETLISACKVGNSSIKCLQL